MTHYTHIYSTLIGNIDKNIPVLVLTLWTLHALPISVQFSAVICVWCHLFTTNSCSGDRWYLFKNVLQVFKIMFNAVKHVNLISTFKCWNIMDQWRLYCFVSLSLKQKCWELSLWPNWTLEYNAKYTCAEVKCSREWMCKYMFMCPLRDVGVLYVKRHWKYNIMYIFAVLSSVRP